MAITAACLTHPEQGFNPSARISRDVEQFTPAEPLGLLFTASLRRAEHHGAAKACAAVRNVGHGSLKAFQLVVVRRGESCREEPRSTIKSVNFQA